jgi:hypothetical protein
MNIILKEIIKHYEKEIIHFLNYGLIFFIIIVTTLFISLFIISKLWQYIICIFIYLYICITNLVNLINLNKSVNLVKLNKANNLNKKIKIISLNIFLRSHFIKNNNTNYKGDYKFERLKEFVKIINEYDIILLQEIYINYSFYILYLFYKSYNLGFKFFTLPKCKLNSFHLMDNGLLILSKFPILQSQTEYFIDSIYCDKLASKGFQYVKICLDSNYSNSNYSNSNYNDTISNDNDTNNNNDNNNNYQNDQNNQNDNSVTNDKQIINIINLHMQSDYSYYKKIIDKKGNEIKIKQLNQIIKFITKHKLSNVFLIGDFNINYYEQNLYNNLIRNLKSMNNLNYKTIDLIKNKISTTYSLYNNIGEEIDTNFYIKRFNNLNYIPRCVDFMFYISNNLSSLNNFKCNTTKLLSKNKDLIYLSDHLANILVINY